MSTMPPLPKSAERGHARAPTRRGVLCIGDRRQDGSGVAGSGRIPDHNGCRSRIDTHGTHTAQLPTASSIATAGTV
ncbi:hypothetical protein I553_2707 [Mycobacterium xenopi 4042]|uniref:Uncharacterized protein n=1 Tax=Mycobacterium xenopi 4042 TaxID=1299334 RepID=X8CMB1_MYCXE|nr:hypothetical protein I553_2707 [Mycobacterium xenopi 4042]